ncbi:MAG: pyridoxal-phosphate dependent enzyme [Pseudomonadales bacterium]
MNVYDNVLEMIGHTPMLQVHQFDTGPCELFLKLEFMNPAGSIKDRIGRSMIEEAERRGDLKPGDTIVEATAGNTGLGLALVATQKGYPLVLVVPDKMSQEKIFNLKAIGAEVVLTRSDVGKGHPEYYQDLGAQIAQERGGYFINQFANPDNPAAHTDTTGPEIWQQMDGKLDAVVVGVGSSGTITGLTRYFQSIKAPVEIVVADPQGSILADYINHDRIPESGSWLVEGIGEDFLPEISDFSGAKQAFSISDAESFSTARALLTKEGIMAGSSTGTLLAAALRFCQAQTEPKRVVTFACDTGNRYLSKLYSDFWMVDQGFIAREHFGDLRDLIGRLHREKATVVVGPDDTLTTAHNRLRNAGFSQLPVIEDGRLIGIISEDDIMRRAFGDPSRFADQVRQAMHGSFLKIERSMSIDNLVALLEYQPCAAVMDTNQVGARFLGLITRSDVLNYLRRQVA